ncbi:MAG: hypothetical protein HGA67_02645 [Candidatus Yonathbacteria bacterium]|nr:hypothetical protein [Candidatus Yonathbacteria bacterium]
MNSDIFKYLKDKKEEMLEKKGLILDTGDTLSGAAIVARIKSPSGSVAEFFEWENFDDNGTNIGKEKASDEVVDLCLGLVEKLGENDTLKVLNDEEILLHTLNPEVAMGVLLEAGIPREDIFVQNPDKEHDRYTLSFRVSSE